MGSFSILISYCLVLIYVRPSHAFWRMACSVSQTSRIDPILSPGGLSGHVHKFAGGNNVNMNSNQASLLDSTCSTCEVQSDMSAYWTPQLYYQHADGRIEEVQNDGMTVYYVGRGGNSTNTKPFPAGFKMISGDSTRRHYDTNILTYQNTRPIADRVSFRCINEANNIPETHYIDNTNCVNGLRAQINFQSCWDGVNLYKADQSHVAYLSGIDYGSCPPTHPVPIPGLFYEVLYWSNRIDQSDGGHFVFSNGDTTGFGFHGDFMNGWDQDIQAQAVQDCLYPDNNGVVAACAPLAGNNDVNFARNCPQSKPVVDEVATGVLPGNRLPGCNPVTSGPADAPQVVCGINSTTPISAGSSTIQSTTTPSSTATSKSQSSRQSSSSTISSKTSSSISGSPGNFAQGAATTSTPAALNISSITTTMSSNITSGTKVVTIAVSGYTTLAIVLPASLNPQTSFSDIAEASSYISSLESIAMAEASATATGLASRNTTLSTTSVAPTTISQSILTVTSNQISVLTTTTTELVPTVASTPIQSIRTVTVYPGGFYDASTTSSPTLSSNGNQWAKWKAVVTNIPNGYYAGSPVRRDTSEMDNSNWGKTHTKHSWNGTYTRGPYWNGTYIIPPYSNGTNTTGPYINATSQYWNASNLTASIQPCNTSVTVFNTTAISAPTVTPIWANTSTSESSTPTPPPCPGSNSTYTYPPSNSSSTFNSSWPSYPGTNPTDELTTMSSTMSIPITYTPSTFLTQYTPFTAPSPTEEEDIEMPVPTSTSTSTTITPTILTAASTTIDYDYDNDNNNDNLQSDDNDTNTNISTDDNNNEAKRSRRWDIRGKRRT